MCGEMVKLQSIGKSRYLGNCLTQYLTQEKK